jgi:hypothetical protein
MGVNMLKFDVKNIGEFQEKTCGKWFTYRSTDNPWALSNGLNFEIDVLDGVRFAKVKKTVVHVCVNEGDSGEPIIELWQLNKHYQPHYQA